tara:strand:+ start:3825 stop:4676 length:852 start_codon:yes stop_codon:yes gene_type:complete
MNKEKFRIIYHLLKTQPWLDEQEEELISLLFEDCKTDEQRQLVLELLNKFTHISHEKFSELINELVEAIVTEPGITSSNTQIVSMTADYNSDSGQFVLYALKGALERLGWRDHLSITNFQRSYREYKKNGEVHKNIILIDEFVGSGKTAVNRAETLSKLYKDQGVDGVTIKIKAIASSEIGIKHIKDNNLHIESLLVLNKGISNSDNEDEIPQKLTLMNELESMLSTIYEGRQLPKLGYGKTECLYSRADGNTPNSVFPIFWWPILANQTPRKTLLVRAMGDA